MLVLETLQLLAGLVALYFGAEWLVAGSSSLAIRLGIAPLIVGLTIVAAGTSTPELLVSLLAAKDGNSGISLGNVIGSNIANIALIMGCAAMISPIDVHPSALKRDYPIMLLSSLLLVGLLFDGELSRGDGALLVAGAVAFILASIWRGRQTKDEQQQHTNDDELSDPKASTVARDLAMMGVGIGGLALGAKLLVDAAVVMAKAFNVPDLVIGITVVAIGTSLPELATSVVAAYRKASDLSVGNVVGSNIFNILAILGLVACILPVTVKPEVAQAIKLDLGVMLGVALIALALMGVKRRIGRAGGALLVSLYIAYMVYLFMRH